MSRRPTTWTASAALKGEGKQGTRTVHLDQHGRRLWDKTGGRHRNFDDATVLRMKVALEAFLLKQKAATGRMPYQSEKAVVDFVDRLVADEWVTSSYNIIVKQVIRPVFRSVKPRQRRKK
jgi:hypothetical protein